MVYPRDVVYTSLGETILLKYVESITFSRVLEDIVFDILKDDMVFVIRSISGKDYNISAKYNADKLGSNLYTPSSVAQGIYDKWIRINTGPK